jgi:hypothetical protein
VADDCRLRVGLAAYLLENQQMQLASLTFRSASLVDYCPTGWLNRGCEDGS